MRFQYIQVTFNFHKIVIKLFKVKYNNLLLGIIRNHQMHIKR